MQTQTLIDDAGEKLRQATDLIAEARRNIQFAMTASDLDYGKHKPLETAFKRLQMLEPRVSRVGKAVQLVGMLV